MSLTYGSLIAATRKLDMLNSFNSAPFLVHVFLLSQIYMCIFGVLHVLLGQCPVLLWWIEFLSLFFFGYVRDLILLLMRVFEWLIRLL